MQVIRQIFQKDYPIMFDKVYRYTVCRISNNNDAEDVISESFLEAWKCLKNFNPNKGSLIGWIFSILKRKIIRYYEKNSVSTISYEKLEENSDILEISESTASDNLEIKMKFENFVSGLTKEELALCYLHYIDGYKYEEIADKLGKKPNTVRKWFSRFKQKFSNNY